MIHSIAAATIYEPIVETDRLPFCRCLAKTRSRANEVNWTEELYADWLVGLITNIQLLYTFSAALYITYTRSNRLCFYTFTIGTRLAMRKSCNYVCDIQRSTKYIYIIQIIKKMSGTHVYERAYCLCQHGVNHANLKALIFRSSVDQRNIRLRALCESERTGIGCRQSGMACLIRILIILVEPFLFLSLCFLKKKYIYIKIYI